MLLLPSTTSQITGVTGSVIADALAHVPDGSPGVGLEPDAGVPEPAIGMIPGCEPPHEGGVVAPVPGALAPAMLVPTGEPIELAPRPAAA
jgi:hypothetical protein